MSRQDAYQCLKAGVKGIVISHGKVEDAVPILKILPDICKVIGKEIPVWVEGEIESGMDAFKALALGATAVSVGRDLMEALKGGADGVEKRIRQLNGELSAIMSRTGAKKLSEIDSSVIWHKNF